MHCSSNVVIPIYISVGLYMHVWVRMYVLSTHTSMYVGLYVCNLYAIKSYLRQNLAYHYSFTATSWVLFQKYVLYATDTQIRFLANVQLNTRAPAFQKPRQYSGLRDGFSRWTISEDSNRSRKQSDGTRNIRNERNRTTVCSLASVTSEFQESP
jgi:hypothetical protein